MDRKGCFWQQTIMLYLISPTLGTVWVCTNSLHEMIQCLTYKSDELSTVRRILLSSIPICESKALKGFFINCNKSSHINQIYSYKWPVYIIPWSVSVTIPTSWTSQTTQLNLSATLTKNIITTSLINTPSINSSRATYSQSLSGSSVTQGKNSRFLYTVHCCEISDDKKQSHQLEYSAVWLFVLRIWPVKPREKKLSISESCWLTLMPHY